jgi:predicted peroxiredoxin
MTPPKRTWTPLPNLEDEEVEASLDVRGDNKTVSIYILEKLCVLVDSRLPGESIDLATDSYTGLASDIHAWGRMTGHSVRQLDGQSGYDRYIIKKNDQVDEQANITKKKVAIIISQDGLLDLISPLGFALGAATAGMDVALYFQGSGVRVLKKGFKGRYKTGLSALLFSGLARNGMAAIGHAPPAEKLEQLKRLGAKIYVCHPSLDHFGVKVESIAFPGVILAEYLTFLEEMSDATVKLYT